MKSVQNTDAQRLCAAQNGIIEQGGQILSAAGVNRSLAFLRGPWTMPVRTLSSR